MAAASSSSTSSGNPVNGHKEPRSQAAESDSDSGEEEIEEGEDEAWENWVEDGDEDGSEGGATLQATHSLFKYEKVLPGPEEALEYDKEESGCDFVAVVARLSLDFHQIIRLINYIRVTKASPEEVNSLTSSHLCLQDDSFLTPVIEDDPLLQLDIEELAAAYMPSTSASHPQETASNSLALQRQIVDLQAQLQMTQEGYLAQRELMEKHFADKFGGISASSEEEEKTAEDGKGKGKKREIDTHYFNSYSQNEIHEIMLKDTVRTESYRNFILSNPSIFKGAVVLDVGCGTGILSMFAAKAGAKKVYAVDASEVAYKAMRNVKENGLEGTVEVIMGKVEEVGDKIKEKVDVIISEWMGYFLLYEAMLDSVLVARDLYLRPGGLLVPSQCSILLAAVQDDTYLSESINYWDDVYGFKMTAMKDGQGKEADVRAVKGEEVVISTVAGIKDVIMSKDTPKDSDFSSSFNLRITRPGQPKVHGFLGWFDNFFTVDGRIMPSLSLYDSASATSPEGAKEGELAFSTGPFEPRTHWAQTFFLLDEAIQVKEGDELEGTFRCNKSKAGNTRELDVEVVFNVKGEKKQRMQAWTVS